MCLTGKQRLFVEHYIHCLNATEAARRAGYKANGNSLRVIGCTNLTKVNIKEQIEKRFHEAAMTADECLARIASHAKEDKPQALKALELVGKHHSLFTEKIEHTVSIDVSNLTNDQLEHLVKHGQSPA